MTNTQDLKILGSDFMSHPLSRGISDCEKAGEAMFDAATEIERLRSENDMLKQQLREEGDRIAHLRDVLTILLKVARRYLPDYDEHPAFKAADDALLTHNVELRGRPLADGPA